MSDKRITVAFGNDHAGLEMRDVLLETLREHGLTIDDVGVATSDSVDYPDIAAEVAGRVSGGRADWGVLVCGTGIGMSIAANKTPGVRAAVCTDVYGAEMARMHNNANVLALRGRKQDPAANKAILEVWIKSEFEGGRHQRRLDKISKLESQTKPGT